jgi:hypothetical protein
MDCVIKPPAFFHSPAHVLAYGPSSTPNRRGRNEVVIAGLKPSVVHMDVEIKIELLIEVSLGLGKEQ